MTSPYQLYFSPGACSRVSIAALEWVGAHYALLPVFLAQNEQLQPAYQALNPKQQVPLLVTAQGVLSETLAIALFLQQNYPQSALLPTAGPYDTAIATSWLAWCSATLHPLIFRTRRADRIHPEAEQHDVIRQVALADLSHQLKLIECTLSDGRPWLCIAGCSLADLYVLWCVQRAGQGGCEIEQWPALSEWQVRAQSHPAWLRMLEREAQAVAARKVGALG